MSKTTDKIAQLEKELVQLREQERVEKEEARKQAAKDKDKELAAIKNAIIAFNDKHGDNIKLVRYDLHIYTDKFWGNHIEGNYIEV